MFLSFQEDADPPPCVQLRRKSPLLEASLRGWRIAPLRRSRSDRSGSRQRPREAKTATANAGPCRRSMMGTRPSTQV